MERWSGHDDKNITGCVMRSGAQYDAAKKIVIKSFTVDVKPVIESIRDKSVDGTTTGSRV